MAAPVQQDQAPGGSLSHDRFFPPSVSAAPRLLDALRRDGVLLAAAPRIAGAAFGAGSDAAVRLFGVESLARLAGEVSAATGLSTLSVARLSAMVMPVLLAACRDTVLRAGEDAAGLAHTHEQLNSFTLCGVSTFESILPIYQYPL